MRPARSPLSPLRALALVMMLCLALDSRAGLDEVVARAKRSVVAVGTYADLANPRFEFRGSGFAVADGNLVITNAHVLPESAASSPAADGQPRLVVMVPMKGGNPGLRSATLVTADPAHDLALLRIDGPALPALLVGDAKDVREGQSIAFIGFPIGGVLGFSPVTHRGIVSSITAIALPMPAARQLNAKAIQRLRAGSFDIYQLDATAYPGNSGGPVFDVDTGAVIGVINMVLVKGTKESALSQPSGITYAVPASFVAEILK